MNVRTFRIGGVHPEENKLQKSNQLIPLKTGKTDLIF